MTKATAQITPATAISLGVENGSRNCPASAAVKMKPTIIMIHTMVAAAARRVSATRLASSTSRLVPAAPTPPPISVKEMAAAIMPASMLEAMICTDTAAPKPPSASAAMPAKIHGVRLPPLSERCPQEGLSTCSA